MPSHIDPIKILSTPLLDVLSYLESGFASVQPSIYVECHGCVTHWQPDPFLLIYGCRHESPWHLRHPALKPRPAWKVRYATTPFRDKTVHQRASKLQSRCLGKYRLQVSKLVAISHHSYAAIHGLLAENPNLRAPYWHWGEDSRYSGLEKIIWQPKQP